MAGDGGEVRLLPILLERHKDELIHYVFDDEPGAGELFLQVEQAHLDLAKGATELSPTCVPRGWNCRGDGREVGPGR